MLTVSSLRVGIIVQLIVTTAFSQQSASGSFRCVCYYTNWSRYRSGLAAFLPENIDPNLCTHLVFAFAGLRNNTLVTTDDNDEYMYQQINSLKTINFQLKTLLSVGGSNLWTSSMSAMLSSTSNQMEFIDSSISVLRTWNFDGLDLNFQYPGTDTSPPEDKNRLTTLIQALRSAFDSESQRTRRNSLMLTATVPAEQNLIDNGFDIPGISQYVDYLSLTTYDYYNTWSPKTGYAAALYPGVDESDVEANLNVRWSAEYWTAGGAPRNKLVIGVPTYGRCWILADPSNAGIGSPTSGPCSSAELRSRITGVASYYEILELLADSRTRRMWSDDRMAPYLVTSDNKFISYDDEQSLNIKTSWCQAAGFGGIGIWSLDLDDFTGSYCGCPHYPLLRAACRTCCNQPTTTLRTTPTTRSTMTPTTNTTPMTSTTPVQTSTSRVTPTTTITPMTPTTTPCIDVPTTPILTETTPVQTSTRKLTPTKTTGPVFTSSTPFYTTPTPTTIPTYPTSTEYYETPTPTTIPIHPTNTKYYDTPIPTTIPIHPTNTKYYDTPTPTTIPIHPTNTKYYDTPTPTTIPIHPTNTKYYDTPIPTTIPIHPTNTKYYDTPTPTTIPIHPTNTKYYDTPIPTTIPIHPTNTKYYDTPTPTTIPIHPTNTKYYDTPIPTTIPNLPTNTIFYTSPTGTTVPTVPTTPPFQSTSTPYITITTTRPRTRRRRRRTTTKTSRLTTTAATTVSITTASATNTTELATMTSDAATTTVVPTTNGMTTESAFTCTGKKNGLYTDPVDCKQFYLCSDGQSRHLRCLTGLYWNDVTAECAWPYALSAARQVACGV